MASILNNALSGLLAYQRALATTSHNIANSTTPGYSRQSVLFNSVVPELAGRAGNGINVDTIRRHYDEFLTGQLRGAVSQQSSLNLFHAQTSIIDDIIADPEGGITPALEGFFAGLQDVANDAASMPARQSFLSQANALVDRFHTLENRMSEQAVYANRKINESVQRINELAVEIRDVNIDLLGSRATLSRHTPADMLDRRDLALQELASLVSVSTIDNGDGSVNVYIGSGQTLVTSDRAFTLGTTANAEDPSLLAITYSGLSGTSDLSNAISGGELGGMLDFSHNLLGEVRNDLGRVAIALGDTFNSQHRNGIDLAGNFGADVFSVAGPQVLTNANNAGAATLSASIVDSSQLTSQDYRLSYDGTDWTLATTDGGSSSTGVGPTLALDGFSVTLGGGAAVAGDSFLVRPARLGARALAVTLTNPQELAAAAPITSAASVANSSAATISSGSVLDVSNANLQDPIEIRFNTPPSTFDILNGSTGVVLAAAQPYTSGGNIDYNGWRVQITGSPAAGDSFSVASNAGGVSDNRNALSLAGLQTTSVLDVTGVAQATTTITGVAGRNDITFVDDVGGNQDGLTFEIQGRIYELDSNAVVGGGNIGIAYTANDTAATIAGLVQAQLAGDVVGGQLVNITAATVGADVRLLSDVATSTTTHTDINTVSFVTNYGIVAAGQANGSTMTIGGVTYEFRFDNEAATVGNVKVTLGTLGAGTQDNQAATLAAQINAQYAAGNSTVSASVATNVVTTTGSGNATASYQEAYSSLVSFVGSRTRQAEVGASAQKAISASLTDRKDAVSGVNLDEEAASLMRFQQAYQAAARVVTTADNLFQSLLNSF